MDKLKREFIIFKILKRYISIICLQKKKISDGNTFQKKKKGGKDINWLFIGKEI